VYQFSPHHLSGGSDAKRPMRPIQGTSEIVGGSALLPQAIAGGLPEERIHLGYRLVALERAGAGVTLTFSTLSGSVQPECDEVILTLPFSALRHVNCQRAGFDALKQKAIEQLSYGAISKLVLEFDQRYWHEHSLWRRPHGGFFITDLDIQTVWD